MVYFELLICEIKLIKACSSQEVLSHLSPVFLRKHNQGSAWPVEEFSHLFLGSLSPLLSFSPVAASAVDKSMFEWTFCQLPNPTRSEVEKPVGPCSWCMYPWNLHSRCLAAHFFTSLLEIAFDHHVPLDFGGIFWWLCGSSRKQAIVRPCGKKWKLLWFW